MVQRLGSGLVRHRDSTLAEYLNSLGTFSIGGMKLPELMASTVPAEMNLVHSAGYNVDTPSTWRRTGATGTPSQSPVQRDDLSFTDAAGKVFAYVPRDRYVNIDDIGATRGSTVDSWPVIDLCLRKTVSTGCTVTGGGTRYLHSKPIVMRDHTHLRFHPMISVDFVYGGGTFTTAEMPELEAPVAYLPSPFADITAQVMFLHKNRDFTRHVSVVGIFFTNVAGVEPQYGMYAQYTNNLFVENCQNAGVMTGFKSWNSYFGALKGYAVSAPAGKAGLAGISITPRMNGRGAGTSMTFERVGIVDFATSWEITELSYSSLRECYSEGTHTKQAFVGARWYNVSVGSYGIENLTASAASGGRIMTLVDCVGTFDCLSVNFNVTLDGVDAVSIKGESVVSLKNSCFIVNTGGAQYNLAVTDNTARVVFDGFRWEGKEPLALDVASGIYTTFINCEGMKASVKLAGSWQAPLQIGGMRLWVEGTKLYARAGREPANATDGAVVVA